MADSDPDVLVGCVDSAVSVWNPKGQPSVSKSNSNRQRRETVEQLRKKAKADERRRTLVVVSICAGLALLIVGVAVFSIYQKQKENDDIAAKGLASFGASLSAANCDPVQEEDATGVNEHVTTKVIYETTPPSFGPHNPTADTSRTYFYTADDRPDAEVLVHNLEHGWTIVWYDDATADNDAAMDSLRDAATNLEQSGGPENNVIIAPWTADDGGDPFPEGKHVAFTHWSVHQPEYDPEVFQQESVPSFGVSQFCSSFSGEGLEDFMEKYPYDDAPEGYLWHQG